MDLEDKRQEGDADGRRLGKGHGECQGELLRLQSQSRLEPEPELGWAGLCVPDRDRARAAAKQGLGGEDMRGAQVAGGLGRHGVGNPTTGFCVIVVGGR